MSRFRDHVNTSPRLKNAVVTEKLIQEVTAELRMDVTLLLDTATAQRIKTNRENLGSMARTVVSCRKQNIALREHCDKS